MSEIESSALQRLAACVEFLDRMDELLVGFEPMTTEETRRAAKLPKDRGDYVVTEVARQCVSIELTRADRDTTVDGMLEALDEERMLREVIARYEEVLARLRGARGRAASESWRSALTFYALLRRLAANEPALSTSLEPVRRYFSERRPPRLRPRARA